MKTIVTACAAIVALTGTAAAQKYQGIPVNDQGEESAIFVVDTETGKVKFCFAKIIRSGHKIGSVEVYCSPNSR